MRSGESGEGRASFEAVTFNSVDGVYEIGSASDSPIGDGCFNFRISDAEIGFGADLVIGDDRIAATEGVLVSDKKPVGDWLFLNFRIGDAEIAKKGIVSAGLEILIGDEEIESASCG